MQANVSLQEVDYNEMEFGDLDRDQAEAAFRSIDWAPRVSVFEQTSQKTDDCCPPSFLVTFGRRHYLSITVQPDRIIVQLSMPGNGSAKIKTFEKNYSTAAMEEMPTIIAKAFDDFGLLFDSI
ncbi:MAG TPA: hypothetical protein PLK08_01005 [Phycisphaerae bacterium]|nr:hypothetical protein [Phycisphaerae bacterium]